MSEPHHPDVSSLTPVETQHITVECRNHGDLTAWAEAVEQLRHVYHVQLSRRPASTISLALYVTDRS